MRPVHYRRILLIEDEKTVVAIIKKYLEDNNFLISVANTGKDAMYILENEPVDAVILDLVLPDIDGLSILKYMRSKPFLNFIPVIIVSSKDSDIDKVIGLEMGADDYISKPFSQRELLARLKSIFRITDEIQKNRDSIVLDNIEINIMKRLVYIDNSPLYLSKKEFDLLHILIKNPNKVFSRTELLDTLWGVECDVDARTIDVHIRYLRRKLYEFGKDWHIESVRSLGYRFKHQ